MIKSLIFIILFLINSLKIQSLNLNQARILAQQIILNAENKDQYCSIAINAFNGFSAQIIYRMDDTVLGTLELALARSRGASLFGYVSQNDTEPDGSLFNIQVVNPGIALGEGSKILSDGTAIGVACNSLAGESEIIQDAINKFNLQNRLFQKLNKIYTQKEVPQIGGVITLRQASLLISNAIQQAQNLNKKVSVSVVDSSGNLKAQETMDDVPRGYALAGYQKARSTKYFDLNKGSDDLNNATKPGAGAYGLQVTEGRLFNGFARNQFEGLFTGKGGIPLYLYNDSLIIGAIGVAGSGSSKQDVDIDEQIAQFAANQVQLIYYQQITLRYRRGITAAEANNVIKYVLETRANDTSINSPGVVSVFDNSGNLRAYYVEDGCELGAPDISLKAGLTSALFGRNTEEIGALSRPGKSLYNIEYNFGGLVTFEAGAPLYDRHGNIIGGIGVSGTGAGRGTTNDGNYARNASHFIINVFEDSCASQVSRCTQKVQPVVNIDMKSENKFPHEGLSIHQAAGLIDSVLDYCQQNNQFACVSVFQDRLQLKAQLCMDDSFIGAIDLTTRKARTAQSFGKPNGDLQKAQQPDGILYKVEVTNGGLFMNPGGIPLKSKSGRVLGSVGVAGAADDGAAVNVVNQVFIQPDDTYYLKN